MNKIISPQKTAQPSVDSPYISDHIVTYMMLPAAAVPAWTCGHISLLLPLSGPDSWECICAWPAGCREERWDTRPDSPQSSVETTMSAW